MEEIKFITHFLLLSFFYLLLLNPTTAICVKRNSSAGSKNDTTHSHEQRPPVPPSVKAFVPALAPNGADHADSICTKTDYPDMCMSVVPAVARNDPAKALEFVINASVNDTQAAISFANNIVSRPMVPQLVGANLKACMESYYTALDSLDKAKDAMAINDSATLNINLSAALTNYDTCEEGFVEMPGLSPMASTDEKLSKHLSNCLAISQLIK